MVMRALLAGMACVSAQLVLADKVRAEDAWDVEGSLALVSDYRWRGVSLSDEDPSLQAEATLSHEGGLWLWGGANSVSDENGDAELGLGAGWSTAFAGLDWSFGAIQYFYTGQDDLDYLELDLETARTFGAWTLAGGIEYIPPQRNYGEDFYPWASAERAFGEHVALHGQIGLDDGSMASADDQTTDYSAGLSATFGAASLDLSYVEAVDVDNAIVARIGYGF
jgi:uncharacterized protein (TIGR02001 family)